MTLFRPALRWLCLLTVVLAAWPLQGADVASRLPAAVDKARVERAFGRIPLSFEAAGDGSSYLARGNGYSIRLDPEGAELSLGRSDVIEMKLDGATRVQPSGLALLPGTANYFLGSDPKGWRTNLPTYARVAYTGVYPGVDLVYYGNHKSLEYDFTVAPQASVKTIRVRFQGARVRLDSNGDLWVEAGHGSVRFRQPIAYQRVGEAKLLVAARFVKVSDTEVAFAVGSYSRSKPLVIDPEFVYSTYFSIASVAAVALDSAGSLYLTGTPSGLPATPGAFQPTDKNQQANGISAFVTKLSPDGQSLVYSTYLGGNYGDAGYAIAVDGGGNAYVTGYTNSTNFPVTAGAYQTVHSDMRAQSVAFLAKLNPYGNGLVYSTYLGGTGTNAGGDQAFGVAVDANGDAYVAGSTYSSDFPVTAGAFQSTNKALLNNAANAFVAKFSADGSQLVYSTLLGGSAVRELSYMIGDISAQDSLVRFGAPFAVGDTPSGIAVDSAGDAFVVGNTASADFPTTPGAFQPANKTDGPGRLGPSLQPFVTKVNPTGTGLIYSTYLGGSGKLIFIGATPQGAQVYGEFIDTLFAIAVDGSGNAYVVGDSGSPDYPVTPGALQTTNREIGAYTSNWTSVFTELNPTGTGLVYSTYLGGSTSPLLEGDNAPLVGPGRGGYLSPFDPRDTAAGLALDGKGNVYIAGSTYATDFPVTSDALEPKLKALSGYSNGYLAVLNPASSSLVYSTYVGGSVGEATTGLAYGAQDNAYLVGLTYSPDFPVTPNAYQSVLKGAPMAEGDVYVYPSADFITKINIDPGGKVLTHSVLTLGDPTGQSSEYSLLATVTPFSAAVGEPTPGGTVTFFNNGSPLGPPVPVGSPVSTASMMANLPPTPDSLSCTYSGDAYYVNSTCFVSPDYALVLATPTVTIPSGQSTTTSATIISISGFADSVTLGCHNIPAQLTCELTPNLTQVAANRSTTVSIYLDTHAPSLSARNRSLAWLPAQLALLLLPIGLVARRRLSGASGGYAVVCCAIILSLATLALSGCGREVYPYALPAGTYTISIAAQTNIGARTQQLTVMVTP